MLVPTDQTFEGVLYSVTVGNISALHSRQSIEGKAEEFLLTYFEAQGINVERGYLAGIGAAGGMSAFLQWVAENWEGLLAIASFLVSLFGRMQTGIQRIKSTARERLIEPYNPTLIVRLQTSVHNPDQGAEGYKLLLRLAPALLQQSTQRLPHQRLSLILIDGTSEPRFAPLRVDALKFSVKEARKHLKRISRDRERKTLPSIYHQRLIFGIFRQTEGVNDRRKYMRLLFS